MRRQWARIASHIQALSRSKRRLHIRAGVATARPVQQANYHRLASGNSETVSSLRRFRLFGVLSCRTEVRLTDFSDLIAESLQDSKKSVSASTFQGAKSSSQLEEVSTLLRMSAS